MQPCVLFCADPLAPARPDENFLAEVEAAARAGFAVGLLSFERLVDDNDAHAALRRLPRASQPTSVVYRGWMLSSAQYADLHAALVERGYTPLTAPEAYRSCHELPASYSFIVGRTPETVWMPREGGFALDQIMAALLPFGAQPLIVKDYVKSRKHEWLAACFIPSAADRAAVSRVVGRFLDLQGDDLQGGLVFRAFVPFQTIGTHPQSGMPLANEYRAIVLDGAPLVVAPYWEGAAVPAAPSLAPFAAVMASVPSRLFTLDVAQCEDGTWLIVELGDGQVAGLPPGTDLDTFYTALAACLSR